MLQLFNENICSTLTHLFQLKQSVPKGLPLSIIRAKCHPYHTTKSAKSSEKYMTAHRKAEHTCLPAHRHLLNQELLATVICSEVQW